MIFQKHRIFELLLEGPHVGYPLGGAPPEAPGTPPGAHECHRVLEKVAQIQKYYIENLHPPKYTKI